MRYMSIAILRRCVGGRAHGGYINYGLQATVQALVEPTSYNSSNFPETSAVQQPDGSFGSFGSVALPFIEGGYSELSPISNRATSASGQYAACS